MRVRPAAHSIKRGASNQSSRQQAATAAVDHRAVFIETNKGKRHTQKKNQVKKATVDASPTARYPTKISKKNVPIPNSKFSKNTNLNNFDVIV